MLNHGYRPHVSPHEFLQSVVLASKGRFQFTKRGNAGDFLTWFLNMLDKTHKKQTKENGLIFHKKLVYTGYNTELDNLSMLSHSLTSCLTILVSNVDYDHFTLSFKPFYCKTYAKRP